MKLRFSYCCGKPVRRKEGVTVRGEGYYCDRCKRELTVYGNPKTEDDKLALKQKRYVKGRGHKVHSNGDLEMIGILYKFADENTKPTKRVSDKWVIIDNYGNFVTCVLLEHDTGAFYEVFEPFENRLYKEKLAAFRLDAANYHGYTVADMKKNKNIRPLLENLGWEFRADGRIK